MSAGKASELENILIVTPSEPSVRRTLRRSPYGPSEDDQVYYITQRFHCGKNRCHNVGRSLYKINQ
jgi:hypothetical protein